MATHTELRLKIATEFLSTNYQESIRGRNTVQLREEIDLALSAAQLLIDRNWEYSQNRATELHDPKG